MQKYFLSKGGINFMKNFLSRTIKLSIFVLGTTVLFIGIFTHIFYKKQTHAAADHQVKVIQPIKESVNANRNQLPWMISKPAGKELEGYASAISVIPGETIKLFINSTKPY